MTESERDGLMPCLFSRQGMMLDNVKFFRGEAKVIRKSDFRKEFRDAEARKEAGLSHASEFADSEGPAIDARQWIAM